MKKALICAAAIALSLLCGCAPWQPWVRESQSTTAFVSTSAAVTTEAAAETHTPPTETCPPATACADSGLEELEQALQTRLSALPGRWSVYVKRLDTGESLCLSDEAMVSASLIKLFVAGAVFQAVDDGTLPAGVYDASVRAMICASDNASCNTLIDVLGDGDSAAGMEAVNRFAASMGCQDTRLNRKMLASRQVENYTSAADCGRLLEAVYNGQFVSPQASEAMLEALKAQTVRCKIPALLPKGTVTASKAGDLDDVDSDVALVYTPGCDYVLCILSNGVSYGQTTHGQIAALSRTVYDYFNPSVQTPESRPPAKPEA